jgi:hypothetical protein
MEISKIKLPKSICHVHGDIKNKQKIKKNATIIRTQKESKDKSYFQLIL